MTNFATPQTPNQAGGLKKAANPKKKSDPVSRYQNMQNQWQKSSFLKASGGTNNKQGRKLELDRFHKWSSLVHQHNQ
jgi:hypothetical protein